MATPSAKARKYIDATGAGRGTPAATVDDVDDADDGAEAPPADGGPQRLLIGRPHDGWRLDRALAALLPGVSRSRLQQWIADGAVTVNERAPRARDPVYEGDAIAVSAQRAPEENAFAPEPMALGVVHEDASIIVLDKPPGLVVHPAAGNWSGTLLNGLLAHDPALAAVPRAGIVHRLDADTSGLMVVARTLAAHTGLIRQLQARSVHREYWAIVLGETPVAGTIDGPIARDPRNPLRFRVLHSPHAREARTHFHRLQVVESDDGRIFSWVACRLDTGRTHQIRVHLESIGHPLVGDPLYRRGRPALPATDDLPPWARFGRQALHACRLGLRHPASGEPMQWFCAPPADLRALMRALGIRRGDKPVAAFDD